MKKISLVHVFHKDALGIVVSSCIFIRNASLALANRESNYLHNT